MEDVYHGAGGPLPLRDCLCTVYPKRPKLRMRRSRLRRSLQPGVESAASVRVLKA